MRTDRHAELGRHQDDRQILVDAAQPAAVDLAEVDGAGLKQLLEEDTVRAVLAGGHANAEPAHCGGNFRMAQHIVRARRLFDPPRGERRQLADAIDGFVHLPPLVRVDHDPPVGPDFGAYQRQPPVVVLGTPADLDLEMRPAAGHRIAAQLPDRRVGIAHPADRRGVGRITGLQQFGLAPGSRRRLPLQDVERFVAAERVADVPEIDAVDDLLGRQIGQQLPHRLALDLRPEVPDGIDDRRQRKVNDALFRSQPAQLRFAGQRPPERREVRGDVGKLPADNQRTVRLDRRGDHFVAASDGERQPVSVDTGIGAEHDVSGGVIGIDVDRIGSGMRARRREPEVEHFEVGDLHDKDASRLFQIRTVPVQ